ncbi:MAG TPA: class I SAM-dependent methyltransferase [Alphaproteobacteria bacterium]|nr:class I SAM-dependent methyltransferase [Alphaproteobacteria bacterium]
MKRLINGRRRTPGKRLRRLRMGLQTVLGLRPQGFFAPYRYAGTVVPPAGYPELEPVFAGADLEGTLALIEAAAKPLADLDGPPPEPRWRQSWFPRLDAAAAYALVLQARPRRIIEVGAGHTTRFLARAAHDAGAETGMTCIDPAPRALCAGLPIDWRREVLSPAHLPLFAALGAGDIAFFDSSHLLWPGTDVDMILNRILPSLAPGVLVHVHDVFLPDAYPEDWSWRGYTEQLGLGGYLTNPDWKIVWASHYAVTRIGAAERPGIKELSMPAGARESSLWLARQG